MAGPGQCRNWLKRHDPTTRQFGPQVKAGRTIAGALFSMLVLGCAPSAEVTAHGAAQPAAIATAICLHSRPTESCDNVRLPDPASAIAYATCLEYNRRDLLRCTALRLAYEAELHAYLGPRQPQPPGASPPAAAPRLAGARVTDLHRTAEQLYKAANSDADTFQAALLLPDIRRKIEAALGQLLPDSVLQALISKTRREAVYWYEYMQRLEQGNFRPQ